MPASPLSYIQIHAAARILCGLFLGAITFGVSSCYSFYNNLFSQDFVYKVSRFGKISLNLRFKLFKVILSAAETIKSFGYCGLFSDYFLCFLL